MNGMRVRLATTVITVLMASAGTVQAGFSASDVFLPMAGRQAGVFPSDWYTTVWIHNPGAAAATARIYLLERNTANLAPPWVDVLVPPGDTEKVENAVESLFHVQVFGALRVTCATQKLVVTSRVYSRGAGSGERDSVGQDFAGVPASFAIGAGERSEILGVHQTLPSADSEYRFNFGFVETTGHPVNVRVRAYDGNGADQGFKDFNVREWSQRQVAFKDHFPTISTENVRLEVEVLSGVGKVIAYGSAIANGSQDPTTFEMEYADALLGGGAVQHDATLVGDGTAAAPLGLADGAVSTAKLADAAVTPAKIDSAGASHGQVLKYGSSVGWRDDGLTLPFSGSAGSTASALDVANTDTTTNSTGILGRGQYGVTGIGNPGYSGVGGWVLGEGVYAGVTPAGVAGTAGAGVGVSGRAIAGTGIYGGSSTGYGVHGESPAGDGVFGESAGDNKSGVYAVNANPNGWAGFFAGRVGITGDLSCTGCVGTGDVAVGAITKDRLTATGAGSNGQVLGTNGAGLVWQAAPAAFTLPFWGEGADANAAFRARNTFSGPTAVGIRGESVSDYGVMGSNTTGGAGYLGGPSSGVEGTGSAKGVYGTSTGGIGVLGESVTGTGVRGNSTSFTAVHGNSTNHIGVGGYSQNGTGVAGQTPGAGDGVVGQSGSGDGVYGLTGGSGKSGVYGSNSNAGGYGLFGRNDGTGATGYLGGAAGGSGVLGGNTGWLGFSASGVYGLSTDSNGNGVIGEANSGGSAYGVWGKSSSGYAGYFSGNVHVVGNLSASGTKPFRIDHPLDPENRVLYHFAVESPDVSNAYHGNTVLDERGEAVVELPAYFEALNRDVRYQLTCIGAFAPVFIAEKVAGNRFRIAGGTAGLEVSWQVTAIRSDPSARLRAPAVEQDKSPEERGFYLDPEAWGQPEELSVEWAHHPEAMQATRAAREQAAGTKER